MIVTTVRRGGYTGTVLVEQYPDNPRESWGVAGTHAEGTVLVELGDRYASPSSEDEQDAAYELVRAAWQHGRGAWKPNGVFCGTYHDTDKVERYARAFLGAVDVQWWDDPRGGSRIFGMVRKLEDDADEAAVLRACLAEYVAYCEGDVYAWQVADADGELIEGCGGYYGEDGSRAALEAMTVAIDAQIAEDRRRADAMYRRMVNTL